MFDRFGPLAFVLLWSSSFVSTRAALNDVSPFTFITLRLALCALVLLILTAAMRQRFMPLAGKWQVVGVEVFDGDPHWTHSTWEPQWAAAQWFKSLT